MTTSRTLRIAALSVPVVYDEDGDHDPDGMLFAMQGHLPLLEWLRDRWEDDDERLPRLHRRRQRLQLAADGLARLELMLARLRHGPDEDRDLLADLLRVEHVPEHAEPEDRLRFGPRPGSARARAVRTNVETTLEEIRVALADAGRDLRRSSLGGGGVDEDGAPIGSGAGAGDGGGEPAPLLVGLSPAGRADLRERCLAQLRLLDRAIDRWFDDVEADPRRRFDAEALAAACRRRIGEAGEPPLAAEVLDAAEVRRLMCNDRRGPGTGPYERVNPLRPVPLVRPLTLRTRLGEPVELEVENALSARPLGFCVQGDGLSCAAVESEALDVPLEPGERRTFRHAADKEGAWPIGDVADVRGSERGTNVHGLFGVLVVEPAGVTWHDPETGCDVSDSPFGSGLYVDVHVPGERLPRDEADGWEYVDLHLDGLRSHREFTTFIHDEPEVHSGWHVAGEHTVMPLSYRAEPMHNRLPHRMRRLVERTRARYGEADGAPDVMAAATGPGAADPIGPVDRTAFASRLGDELEEQFWTARSPDGRYLERVAGEEQHHSSWLFGDPATPILRAYAGDPARVRLVHAGVKETHVWHLHVHQWRLVPQDTAPPSVHGIDDEGRPRPKGSQLVDAVTIGPQTAVTIDPLYGSGSRQRAVGDIIWHCHLYPHFHHGMWGLWRSHDRYVDGTRPYPDGRPCTALQPLPGREPPGHPDAPPTARRAGFPWFVDGEYPMKSPPPPALTDEERCGRRALLRMPAASADEVAAMDTGCRQRPQPGALFTDLDGLAAAWNAKAGLRPPRTITYDIEVRADRVEYNVDGWHDPRGHRYRLLAARVRQIGPDGREHVETRRFEDDGRNPEPIFPRANHGDVVELRLHDSLGSFPADGFDVAQAPVECGLHVHLVKFDVLAADGSSTGWNYLSGASCREAVGTDLPGEEPRVVSRHRWVVDEEFGPCFFHDHLLANFRQKHGLFAALVAEPHGSQWCLPTGSAPPRGTGPSETEPRGGPRTPPDDVAWDSAQAVVVPPVSSGLPPYREACLAVGDFVPLLDRGGRPLNPPGVLSGDDDPGAMAVNYRNAPLTFRGDDPSRWFSTSARSRRSFHGSAGDPDTPLVEAYPGERLRIRLIQGSHEEQHSFVASGLRWRRDWGNAASPLDDQQSLGISEAFTLDVDPAGDCPTAPGDHLWRFAPVDDVWTGCWGYVRLLRPDRESRDRLAPLPDTGSPSRPDTSGAPAETRLRRPSRRTDGSYDESVRTHLVVARRTEHRYAGGVLTDPWGLVLRAGRYEPTDEARARRTGVWPRVRELDGPDDPDESRPLVLRARRGEWVRVILVNEVVGDDAAAAVPGGDVDAAGSAAGEAAAPATTPERWSRLPEFDVEPSPPRLPLEHLDGWKRPDARTVSPRVSLHPSLVLRDVRSSDGSAVGRNPDQTVAHRPFAGAGHGHGVAGTGGVESRVVVRGHGDGRHAHDEPAFREYFWYADEALAPPSHADGPGRVCLLEDLADVRNHRHHGLVGALVVLPGDVTPVGPDGAPQWTGAEADLVHRTDGRVVAHDAAVFVQDGLRLFVNGHPDLPVPDVDPGGDPEDSGHKALSYRSAAVRRGHHPTDAAPLVTTRRGVPLWLRVLGAGDKPRQHSLTLHGHAWRSAPWVPDGPWSGAVSGIAPGFSDTLVVDCARTGDFPLRSGAYRWGTELGVWATIRVTDVGIDPSRPA